jgi:hypothetical protein
MPATRIKLAYEEGYDLSGTKPSVTDVEDSRHVACGVYCDVAFVDRRTHKCLAGCGYLPDHVRRNGECEELLRLLLGP